MRLRESIVRFLTLVPRRLAYNRALELMRRSAGRPSLVIVGNSRFDFDCGAMVDAADTVVRMNDCKNSVGRSGRKTSILCINNCGAPARRYVDGAILRKIPICVEAREIWIPRESEVHRKHAARHQESAMLRESDDLTSAILKANGLADRVVVRLTAALNEQMFEAIQQARRRHAIADPAWMPSTGLLTVAGVLSDPRFSAYHVHLVGYRFQGWAGHPWRAERTILAEQERNGRLTIHRF